MKTDEQIRKEVKEKVLIKINIEGGNIIRLASKELRDDKEVVLAAVSDHGHALSYASDRLKNDKEVVLAAVKQNGYALRYANIALRDDREVAIEAINTYHESAQYVNRRLFDDEEFIMSICNDEYRNIIFNEFGSHRLKTNKKFMLKLIDSLYRIYDETIEPEFTNDIDVIRVSLNRDIHSLRFFQEYLYKHPEILINYIYEAIYYANSIDDACTFTLKNLNSHIKLLDTQFISSETFITFLSSLKPDYYIAVNSFTMYNMFNELELKRIEILKNKIIEDLPLIKSWSEDMLLTHYENIYYDRNEDIQPVALPDFD